MSAASDDESLKSEDGTFNPMKKSSILHPSLVLRNGEDIPHPDALGFEEELPGWHGYVEWEKYPEKKKRAKELMKQFNFPSVGSTFFPLLSRTDKVGA
jgi:sulfite oxidase